MKFHVRSLIGSKFPLMLTGASALAVACGDAGSRPSESVAISSSAISGSGASNDFDTPENNVVVRVIDANADPADPWAVSCSGTLITPTAVLTAKHCVNGTPGRPGLTQPLKIVVGAQLPQAYLNALPFKQVGDPAVMGDPGPLTTVGSGDDVAIIFLDSKDPVVAPARIVRPSLQAPMPQGGDPGGSVYDGPIGIAGWSPIGNHDRTRRQVAFINSIYHYPVGAHGQTWSHNIDQTNGQGGPGDSGGPLFLVRPDGSRDVLGVYSGVISESDPGCNRCGDRPAPSPDHTFADDFYTDVTRGDVAQFIRNVMIIEHTAFWKQAHGITGDFWSGEVEYLGLCDTIRDADCDHWFDVHDNCPAKYNPGQEGGEDPIVGLGRGFACPLPPPPRVAPTNCTPMTGCDDTVTMQCDNTPYVVELRRWVGPGVNDYRTVARDDDPSRFHIPFLTDTTATGDTVFYRVCATNAGGTICTADPPIGVALSHTACGGGGGGGGGGVCVPAPCRPPKLT